MPEPVQILTVRVLGLGELAKPDLPRPPAGSGASPEPVGTRRAHDLAAGRITAFAVYRRESLEPGQQLPGPAIVEEGTATTVIFGDQQLAVDDFGHLLITPTPTGGTA